MSPLIENLPGMIGRHPSMLEVYRRVRLVAPRQRSVLIVGETGTGKELVARALHRLGRSRGAPFEAVNCAAIPETLAEAELFGAEKGAYTGSGRNRPGALARAHGGTLYLDEVCSMSLAVQGKLLRAIEDHRFRRVGGQRLERAEFRVVASVSEPLEGLVERGTFRPDLSYRLRGVVVPVPPLRDRPTDIPDLARRFLTNGNAEGMAKTLDPGAIRALLAYRWPGNVRELQALMETLETLVSEATISAAAVYRELAIVEAVRGDRRQLAEVLAATDGNVSQAARASGIPRPTLHRWLREVGLAPAQHNGRPAKTAR